MLTITKEFTFHAAHFLLRKDLNENDNKGMYGKCFGLHGHMYWLLVTVSGKVNENGMIINFDDLVAIVSDSVINRYDHAFLNELEEYHDKPTTCENMVIFLFNLIEEKLMDLDISLEQLTLFETPTSSATYKKNA